MKHLLNTVDFQKIALEGMYDRVTFLEQRIGELHSNVVVANAEATSVARDVSLRYL